MSDRRTPFLAAGEHRHDLDELCARKATTPDILREQLDGRTGR